MYLSPFSVGEAEDAFGDDAELDLAGSAFDRVAARAQPVARSLELVVVEAFAFPAESLRAGDRRQQMISPHVELGRIPLEQRAFGARFLSGSALSGQPSNGELEAAPVHLAMRDLAADLGRTDAAVFGSDVTTCGDDQRAFLGRAGRAEDLSVRRTLELEHGIADRPSVVDAADDVAHGDSHPVEERLAER